MSSNAIITLRKKPNKLGLFPLAIRVTKNRKSNYIYIGHYVSLKDWDEKKKMVRKSFPNADYLNNLLACKLSETLKVLLELQTNNTDISSKQIKKEITFKDNGKSFFEVADIHMKELLANNKFSRLSVDKAYLDHLLNFAQSSDFLFKTLMKRF